MSEPAERIQARIHKRSLPELLVRKFLTEYGYTHGPVIAAAIVRDILETIEQCCPERVAPKTVIWLAVRREWQGRQKGLDVTDLTPVRLEVVTEEEVALLRTPELRGERQARTRFNQARFARWCFEAYAQGGVLTHLDLSMLSGLSEQRIGKLLREYEQESGRIVPTRGTVHDMGPGVTHKAEVIRRWLRKESPAQIARALGHSQEAVDRYIKDYHRVETLWKHAITDLDQISQLTRLSKKVAQQYIDLLPDKVRKTNSKFFQKDDYRSIFDPSGETEAGSAEVQPAEG